MDNNILGVGGLEASNLNAGVGFVIIPNGVDIKTYKEDVYRSGRISIYGGYGHSNFYNILIDSEALQKVKFPERVGDMGTPVVWINIPKHNEPIVVASLKYDEDFYSVSEFRNRITRGNDGIMTDFDMDGKNGKIRLNVTGNQNKSGEYEINVSGPNSNSTYKLNVDGKVLEKSSDEIIRLSEKRIINVATKKDGITAVKLEINSEDEKRLDYQDDFGNSIESYEDKLNIRANNSSKIDFGDGSEKAVLGNTLLNLLTKYDQAFEKMTVNTAFGPSSTRINNAEFLSIRSEFETILSKLVNLD